MTDASMTDRILPANEASGSSSANSTAGLRVTTYLAGRGGHGRENCATSPKKCYNFRLATGHARTASCVCARTATLLLVVDWYSQVLGAAVHQY